MPRNVTVTFADGTSHIYAGVPDDVTPDAVEQRAFKEFNKKVTGLDGGKQTSSLETPEGLSKNPNEGMPVVSFDEKLGRPVIVGYDTTPRAPATQGPLDKTWSAITGGRNLDSDLSNFRDVTRFPSFEDVGSAIYNRAQTGTQTASEGAQKVVEGFKAGRPLDVVLGAGQQLMGGADILASPVTGAARAFIAEPAGRFLGPDVQEKIGLMTDMAAIPYGLNFGARSIEGAANLGARARNAVQNVVRPDLNALIEATGNKAPEVVNALRGSTSGFETAPQAAAPAGSTGFSKLSAELAAHAPEVVADTQRTRDALLAARSNMAEGRVAEGSRTLADTVADPNTQSVGQRLIDTAEKHMEDVRSKIIRPKFKAAETLANGAETDVSNVLKKAAELTDTIDPDAAAVLSRKLSKFEGKTTTPETYVPLGEGAGYSVVGKPVTKPPMATLEDIGDIRSAINDAAAKAKAAGQARDYSRLMDLHDEVTNAVKNSNTLSQDVKDAYFDAVKTYNDVFVPQFKTGLQVNLFKIKNGVHGIEASNLIDKFFKNADTTDNFVALFGKNPSAMNDARLGMEGLFRDQVIKNGVIDTKAAEKFFKDYGPQIDKLDATGLNLRDKFNALVRETDRVTAPKGAIAETRAGVKTDTLPEGSAKTAADAKVTALVNNTTAEDLTSLRDAVQAVRRETARVADVNTANEIKSGLPIVPSTTPNFLNTKLRIITEVYRRVMGRLDTKMAKELGAMLHDPSRLDEVANLLDAAIARRNAQNARIVSGTKTPPSLSVGAGVINALAPPQQNQNALAGQ